MRIVSRLKKYIVDTKENPILTIYSTLKYSLRQGKEDGTGLQECKGSERMQVANDDQMPVPISGFHFQDSG